MPTTASLPPRSKDADVAAPGFRLHSAALLIAARNLRVAALARGPIALRCLVAALLLLALLAAANERGARAAQGLVILQWFDSLNLWVIEICGIALFPSLIAGEREQRTWTLLRLAGIGPGGFLLGQSLGALALMLFVVAVQVPFLLLAIALGGTDLDAVLGSVAVLGVNALMVYALALLASAQAPTVAAATWRAAILVSMATFVPAALENMVRVPSGILTAVHPYLATTMLAALREGATVQSITGGLMGQLTVAAVALTLGWLRFDASDEQAAGAARRWGRRRAPDRFRPGLAAVRALGQRVATGGPRTWLVFCCLNVALLLYTLGDLSGAGLGRMAFTVEAIMMQSLALLVLAAFLGAWSIHVHRRAGALPLLALTQADGVRWLRGVRQARWITLAILAAGLPVTLGLGDPMLQNDFSAFLVMVAAGAMLADAVGERCGLVFAIAPWAVSLLLVLGVAVLLFAMGLLTQPREIEVFFMLHACAYLAVALALAHGTVQRLRASPGGEKPHRNRNRADNR